MFGLDGEVGWVDWIGCDGMIDGIGWDWIWMDGWTSHMIIVIFDNSGSIPNGA